MLSTNGKIETFLAAEIINKYFQLFQTIGQQMSMSIVRQCWTVCRGLAASKEFNSNPLEDKVNGGS